MKRITEAPSWEEMREKYVPVHSLSADRLVEHVSGIGSRVDTTSGTIRDVKILGSVSRNGRTYSESAMRGAVGLYEGVKVFLEHPLRENERRSIADAVGWLERPRFDQGAIFADVHLIKSHPYYGRLLEWAERHPRAFGMSHVATGAGVGKTITTIEKVVSVDIVLDPATTNGLFESVSAHDHVPSWDEMRRKYL